LQFYSYLICLLQLFIDAITNIQLSNVLEMTSGSYRVRARIRQFPAVIRTFLAKNCTLSPEGAVFYEISAAKDL